MQKIVPHLWFDKEASEAAEFYTAAFPNSRITDSVVLHDTPGGDSESVSFTLNGYDFMAISAGPLFKINQSISFMVNFDPSQDDKAAENLDRLWNALIDGGVALMPLDEYPFSKRYGWVRDRYGVTWQLMLTNPDGDPRPYLIPSLMFGAASVNKAEEAIQFYLETFADSKPGMFARYPEQTGPAHKDSLMFADFTLLGQWFAAMDSGVEQDFTFNEAVSLVVRCDNQQEIDEYWAKLSAVPEAEQCGWCKDKYGVSWQIVPTSMHDMMSKGSQEQVARVTQAFLQMKKFDIAALQAVYDQ
jgi:predicted 3-demethylubiquinone-9 3-methyltransferase (glyoxalase superfamily)